MGSVAIEQKLTAAREVGQALADAEDVLDSIYIGGSLTAGLGNATSDADLFVLVGPSAAVDDQPTQYSIGGHRVDVERRSVVEVESMVARLTDLELRRDDLTALHELPGVLDFVCRLRASEILVDSERLRALRRRIEVSLPAIRRTAVNCAAAAVNGHLEDFVGAAAEGDLDTAALVGQSLVAHAGKAVTSAAGDLYASPKWVYKQLARTPVKGFPLDLFAHYQRGAWTERGRPAAEELILFVQSCVAVAQLLDDAGAPLDSWPGWEQRAGSEGWWRSTGFNVMRTTEGVLLHWELDRQVVLKEQPAFIWALCDGRSTDEIVDAVHLLAEHVPTLRGVSRTRVEAVLAALRDKELVGTVPFSRLSRI